MSSQDNSTITGQEQGQEQEQEHHAQVLSPVSPKPIHLPSAANVQNLEDQMRLDLNDPSAQEQQQQSTEVANNANGIEDPNTSVQAIHASTYHNQADGLSQPQEMVTYSAAEDTSGSDVSPALAIDTNEPNAAVQARPLIFDHNLSTPQEQPATAASSSLVPPEPTQTLVSSTPTAGSSHLASASLPSQDVSSTIAAEPNSGTQAYNEAPAGVPPATDIQALLNSLTAQFPPPAASAAQDLTPFVYPDAAAAAVDAKDRQTDEQPALQDQAVAHSLPSGLPPRPVATSINSPTANDGSHQYQSPTYPSPQSAAAGGQAAPLPSAGAPGTSYAPVMGLPPPPSAMFPPGQLPMNYPPGTVSDNLDPTIPRRDLDKWGPEMQKLYDKFLEEERLHVQEGQWEKFPKNSRLFVGNLSTERVTKRDLFHVFHRHGRIAQISIKQAYGFIQYFDEKCCIHALQAEQGIEIRDKKVHLEISKPQRDKKPEKQNNRNRRSRSPESRAANKSDRFRGRGRDDYRPGRDSPPRRESFRSDRYDGSRRSRSRSPYDRNSRYRSRSPHRREADEDAALPLPRRSQADVPDVQVLARDDPPQRFLTFIESAFKARGISCNVLILSPRLDSKAVMRRQILEGVLATMEINRRNEMAQTFNITIFNRSAGADKINFDEYQDQPINVIIELVARAQKTHRPPPQAQNPYGLPMVSNQHGYTQQLPQQQQQQSLHQRGGSASDLSSMLSGMDPTSIQQLLARMQQSPQAPQSPGFPPPSSSTPFSNAPFDLSRLLGNANLAPSQPPQNTFPAGPQSPTSFNMPQHNGNQQFANLASNPAFAGLFGNATPTQLHGQTSPPPLPVQNHRGQPLQSPNGQGNINDIMDALTKYQR